MPDDVVHKRLEEIGKFVRGERKRQQIWQVPDPSFSHVIVGFDAKRSAAVCHRRRARRRGSQTLIIFRHRYTEAARRVGDVAIKNSDYEWTLTGDEQNNLVW